MSKCEICGREFETAWKLSMHIKIHKINPEEYYVKYINFKGKCKMCGKDTRFISIKKGYCNHCSTKCSANSPYLKKKRKDLRRGPKNRGAIIIENPENKLCDYGCGQIAKFKFVNGKVCCDNHYRKCPVEKNKNLRTGIKNKDAIKIDNLENKLCDYGCGELARYIFKNGKYCCGSNFVKCPAKKEKNKGINIGKKLPKYEKICNPENKLCDYGCGQIAKFQLKNGKLCCSDHNRKCHSMKNKYKKIENSENKLCDYGCGEIAKFQLNDEKSCCSNHFTKCPGYMGSKLNFSKVLKRYPDVVKIENLIEGPNGEILGHCKNSNCPNSAERGGRFTLTQYQIQYRNQGINSITDGSYFYCCEECKKSCILFGNSAIKLKNIINPQNNKNQASSQELSIWRSEIFTRQLKDNVNHQQNFCEICHKTENLVGHHIQPQKLFPEFALDPDNGIVLCEECHVKYGHEKGTECSTGYLANKNCK
jgi:hypothetical protein